jgi:aminomethyltransferase
MSNTLSTPLTQIHTDNGAKMVPFAGYKMPIWYSSIQQEHLAVRKNAGIFDVSHMGLLILSGDGVDEWFQTLSCNSVATARKGKMVYSMMLNNDGGILDDIMFGCADDNITLIVNASNKAKILDWMAQTKPDSVTIEDLNATHGLIAIQGPEAAVKLTKILNKDFTEFGRFSIQHDTLNDSAVTIMRTGYTGEDGFEILADAATIQSVWNACVENGIEPCGLGSRDTLRIEAGLPLYGQDLSESITPLMTRYQWVLKWDKDFAGKAALEAQKESNEWTTVGIEMLDRVIPRTGYAIEEGGEVTSGTMSPLLDKPIAMARVKIESSEPGTKLTVDVRGKKQEAVVVALPFI